MFEAYLIPSIRKKTSELDLESCQSESGKSESLSTPLSKTKSIQKNYGVRLNKKLKHKVTYFYLILFIFTKIEYK